MKVHGKCILLGEHSVVRGYPALVFPLLSRALEIKVSKEKNSFTEPLQLTIKKLQERLNWNVALPELAVTSDIPMQAGLGSSAALSIAVVRFLKDLEAPVKEELPLAMELEDIFHGKSSGIDVAAVSCGSPIRFQREKPIQKFSLSWKPHLYLVDTGIRSSTKKCVEKVAALKRSDLDEEMGNLVNQAQKDLENQNLSSLANSMNSAHDIFREWNLVPFAVEKQRASLLDAGALAAKLTGSGDGGFLLTLWEKPQDSYLSLF